MHDPVNLSASSGEVSIHIMDPTSGRPIKTWTFEDRCEITIGRAPDQDLEISDPFVSRHHASLLYADGHWVLLSFGRNGVVVGDQRVKEHPVDGEVTFRLGIEGPTLKFCESDKSAEIGATISFSAPVEAGFFLDQKRVEREVEDIAAGDYFQSLNSLAKEMRQRRQR